MRKFYFLNSIGEKIDLNDRNKYIFSSPEGLGILTETEYVDLDGGFYKIKKQKYSNQTIIGELVILGDSYANYRELVNWLYNGKDIMFVYCPYGDKEYRINVDIETLEKSEIGKYNVLVCTLNMKTKTPWYLPTAKVISVTPGTEESSSEFDLEFDVTFIDDNTSGDIVVSSGGQMESSLKIDVEGPLYNPSIELYKGDEQIGMMKLDDITIPSGSTLHYSSLYTDAYVKVNDQDYLPYLNLAYNNFFKIPLGDGCRLKITSDQIVGITATVYVYDYFRSV